MHHNIYHLNSFDGTQLFVQLWQPSQKPLAVICLVHGIGEHSSRYHHWAEKFVKHDYAVIGFDQRGHGLSSGKRGVISSYQDFLNDIDLILAESEKHFNNTPSILYGHSMGGGEVLNHLLTRKSNYLGVISTSPWIRAQAVPPKIAIPFIRVLNKIIPSFSLETKFDSDLLSHDAEIVRRYNEDDLVHYKISFRLFMDAYDKGYEILQNTNKIKKPLLLLHGSDDKITDPLASKTFSENNKEYCTFKMWDGGYHELHHEPFKDDVFAAILSWIEEIRQKK